MYQHVKELRACIDRMYDTAMKQDTDKICQKLGKDKLAKCRIYRR